MRKFLAVVRHEYRKIVLKWTFLLGTLLFPVIGAGFAVVPAIIFSLKGEPTRIVVLDRSGKIKDRLVQNLSAARMSEKARKAAEDSLKNFNGARDDRMQQAASQFGSEFIFVDFDPAGRTEEQVREELNLRAASDQIDAYLLIPADIMSAASKYEFRSRKAGDFVANDSIRDALNDAVRAQRLADANISEAVLTGINRPVDFDAKSISDKGEEKDGDSLFLASLVIGMMIYISLTIYGQVIMGAVVEEKETRIAEILFSSAKPFELMFGKLVGVGLAGLTQLGIWVGSLVAIVVFLSTRSDMAPVMESLPQITPVMIVYFFAYFIVGYFTYAAVFALIGSMVTTVQEGGQFAFPPIMIMLVGFYFGFAVIRDPDSTLAFWVSMSPFFAPLTMPIRILAQTPPVWQILSSLSINALAIAGLVWLAGRVYRVGMLMYGKRATIPEALKWIRQA